MLCGGQLVIFAVWVFHVPNSSLTGIINRMHKITFMHSMICILSLWLQCYITTGNSHQGDRRACNNSRRGRRGIGIVHGHYNTVHTRALLLPHRPECSTMRCAPRAPADFPPPASGVIWERGGTWGG